MASSRVVLDGLEDDCLLATLPQMDRRVPAVSLMVATSFGNPRGDCPALASKRLHLGPAVGERPDVMDPEHFEAYVHNTRIVTPTLLAIDQDQRVDRTDRDLGSIGLAAVIAVCAMTSLALGPLIARKVGRIELFSARCLR